MNEDRAILAKFNEARQTGLAVALATIVTVTGSSYRRPGAKMLITENGEISGSISGGCLERDLIRRALQAIDTSEPALIHYDTRADRDDDESESLIQSAGLGCEGVIEIFINPAPDAHLGSLERAHREMQSFEFSNVLPDGKEFLDLLSPPISLIIFGAGHDAIPMVRLAHEIGWDTTLVDCHSSFPAPRRLFGDVTGFISCDPEQILERVKIRSESPGFLMTHNYAHDRAILKQIFRKPMKYLGLLGPRTRSERLLAEIKKENIRIPSEILHFPMGLDIGGDTPQAIAFSALAAAQAFLSGRKGGFLSERQGPIHG